MLVSVPRSRPGGGSWRPSAPDAGLGRQADIVCACVPTNGWAGTVSQTAKDLDLDLAVGLASDSSTWLPVLSFAREQILPSLQAHDIAGDRPPSASRERAASLGRTGWPGEENHIAKDPDGYASGAVG